MVSLRQIRAARALLGWSQNDLAAHAGVSAATVYRLERAEGDIHQHPGTRNKVLRVLHGAGVIFTEQNGEGLGVMLRNVPAAE